MVFIKGPKFRPVKFDADRELTFKANRTLPYGKKGIVFRKKGVQFRKRGVAFGNDGVSNIDIDKKEDPTKLNNLGIKYYNKGKYEEALEYFDKAISIAPQFTEASKNRVYCIKMINAKKERAHQLENEAMLRRREREIYGREHQDTTPPSATSRPARESIPVFKETAVVVRPIDHSEYSWHDFKQPYESDYSRSPGKDSTKLGSAKWSGPARRSF